MKTFPVASADVGAVIAALPEAARTQVDGVHPVTFAPDPDDPGLGFVTTSDEYAPAVAALLADLAGARAGALAALKGVLKVQADAAAEEARLTLITAGSGQAMEYQEAYAEAVQVDAEVKAGQPVAAAAFPMLQASVGTSTDPQTGQPTADVVGEARAVLTAYDAYQKAGAAIRAARLKGKAAIEAAADEAAARAALAAIRWAAT